MDLAILDRVELLLGRRLSATRSHRTIRRKAIARGNRYQLLTIVNRAGRRVRLRRVTFAFAALTALVACADSRSTAAESDAAHASDVGVEPAPVGDVAVSTSLELCKLLSNRNTSDPTPNDVQHRANILGADLGIPVVFADTLYLLFGDTIGFAGIWGGGESHPDAVGYGVDPASLVATEPDRLCSGLRALVLSPGGSIGPTVDPSVVADFAGAAMTAPAAASLGDFIHNPSGRDGAFPNLPGDFEVPSGAFATGDSIYVFYTTVDGPTNPAMTASYLARWRQPSPAALPSYDILYQVDERFDANGPLGGQFINIAAQVSGDYVYLFGTGDYRRSAIAIARKRLDALDTPGGFELVGQVTATPGYGELSVRWFPDARLWMVLAEELLPASNRIVAYVAPAPDGPWQAPLVVHDMADPGFRATYCCGVDDDCEGAQMFDCDRTGFYGSYLMPAAVATADGFAVAYTMSSFAPYNVALFTTTFTR